MLSRINRWPYLVDVALLGVAVVWGSSYLATKEIIAPGAVAAILALRFVVSAGGLSVALLPRLRGLNAAEMRIGGALGLVLAVIFALETVGVTGTSATNAGLIISLTIVITPILEQATGRARVAPRFYLATGAALLGVVLLTQSGGFTRPGLGDLLMLAAAVVRAGHVLLMKRMSAGRELDSGRLTLVQLGVAAVGFLGYAAATRPGISAVAAALSPADWLLLVYLALFCTVFAFVVQMWAVRASSPSRVSLLLGTEPLWAAAVGIAFGGDRLTAVSAAGAVLVLAGVEWGRRLDGARAPLPAQPPERVSS